MKLTLSQLQFINASLCEIKNLYEDDEEISLFGVKMPEHEIDDLIKDLDEFENKFENAPGNNEISIFITKKRQ